MMVAKPVMVMAVVRMMSGMRMPVMIIVSMVVIVIIMMIVSVCQNRILLPLRFLNMVKGHLNDRPHVVVSQ